MNSWMGMRILNVVLSVETGSIQDLSVSFLGMLNTDQMPALRSSNLDRAAYRTKCRQKLSQHIRKVCYPVENSNCWRSLKVTKLGISIEPAEVRLITSNDDPYTWQKLSEKQHLFKKH